MGRQSLREDAIRPDALIAEQKRRYSADVEWLLERSERFVEVTCPACGGRGGDVAWRKYGLRYLRCERCRTVYMNPRPGPELLAEYYANSQNYEYWNRVLFPASEATRREMIFRPRVARLLEHVRQQELDAKVVVDVGAGYGTFCDELQRLRTFERVIAVEPEPHLAASCREKGIEVIEAPVEEVRLHELAADVLTAFEVVEHLFAPGRFLQACYAALRPGGLCVLTCPNVAGFDIEVLGEKSDTVDTEHLNYFHPDSLAAAMESAGFEVLERETPGRLDAELVRKKALAGEFDLEGQPFLEQVLVSDWERLGGAFQDFLVENGLSSNMWLIARRRA